MISQVSKNARSGESGQVMVLVLILLALAAGAGWYARSARAAKERAVRAYVAEISKAIIFRGDARLLDRSLSPEAELTYPPSWRERLFEFIRAQGQPLSDVRVSGEVQFTNYFLNPQGSFKSEVDYANGPAYLQLHVSQHGVLWEIDYINWIWQRLPGETAPLGASTPGMAAPPSETVTSTPTRKRPPRADK